MLKRNKKIIKIILFSLAITGVFKGNANAINSFKNIETKANLISFNTIQDEDKRRERLIQEYQTNKFLKDFANTVQNFEQNISKKGHDEQVAAMLDISQKAQLAKNSNTLSKEALAFIDEVIKDLEPNYTNFLNEAKNKGMKPAPMPKESKDEIKPVPKEKSQEAQQKKQKFQEKIEKHLPKTGSILDNNLFLQLGTMTSLLGVYIIKKKK